jgi:hypothetical protein
MVLVKELKKEMRDGITSMQHKNGREGFSFT